MTQRKQSIKFCSHTPGKNKRLATGDKTMEAIEKMIQGYQEMAEINLTISKRCFEVESEADGICIRLTECE